LPDLEHAKAAVLNSLNSADAKRGYRHAIDEFVDWYCSEPRLAFNRIVVLRYRSHLKRIVVLLAESIFARSFYSSQRFSKPPPIKTLDSSIRKQHSQLAQMRHGHDLTLILGSDPLSETNVCITTRILSRLCAAKRHYRGCTNRFRPCFSSLFFKPFGRTIPERRVQSISVVILLYEFQESVVQVLEVAIHSRVDLFSLDRL
jgi:hypothetical protein